MITLINNLFSNIYIDIGFKLILAFMLSAIIGFERDSWHKPAGFRTHCLICLSSVLVMLCSKYLYENFGADISRIPGQLLTGIGFIGAGTIMRDGINVKGLTTAAGLLAITCIGLCIGAGLYLTSIVTTIIIYCLLSYTHANTLDHFCHIKFKIETPRDVVSMMKIINKKLPKQNIDLLEVSQIKLADSTLTEIKFSCEFNYKIYNKNSIMAKLADIEDILSISEF